MLKFYFHELKTLFHGLKILSSCCKDTFFFRFHQIIWPEMIKDCLRYRSKPVHSKKADKRMEMENQLKEMHIEEAEFLE